MPPYPEISVANPRGNHLDEELVFVGFPRQRVFPLPVVLRVGHYCFAGDGVL